MARISAGAAAALTPKRASAVASSAIAVWRKKEPPMQSGDAHPNAPQRAPASSTRTTSPTQVDSTMMDAHARFQGLLIRGRALTFIGSCIGKSLWAASAVRSFAKQQYKRARASHAFAYYELVPDAKPGQLSRGHRRRGWCQVLLAHQCLPLCHAFTLPTSRCGCEHTLIGLC